MSGFRLEVRGMPAPQGSKRFVGAHRERSALRAVRTVRESMP